MIEIRVLFLMLLILTQSYCDYTYKKLTPKYYSYKK